MNGRIALEAENKVLVMIRMLHSLVVQTIFVTVVRAHNNDCELVWSYSCLKCLLVKIIAGIC